MVEQNFHQRARMDWRVSWECQEVGWPGIGYDFSNLYGSLSWHHVAVSEMVWVQDEGSGVESDLRRGKENNHRCVLENDLVFWVIDGRVSGFV
jgi:hypothetical protein